MINSGTIYDEMTIWSLLTTFPTIRGNLVISNGDVSLGDIVFSDGDLN